MALWTKKESKYIEEVLGYETRYQSEHGGKNGYPPSLLKLLLSIYIRLGDLLVVLSFCLGLLLVVIAKP